MLTFIAKVGAPLLDVFAKQWKVSTYVLFATIAIICILTHWFGVPIPYVSGQIKQGKADTTIVSDTLWLPVDTNAIFTLHGFDTLPDYVKRLETRKWELPSVDLSSAVTSSDSAAIYRKTLEDCDSLLTDCDKQFRDATAINGYDKEIKDDSLAVNVKMEIAGRIIGEPTFTYRRLKQPVIETTERISRVDTLIIGPRKEFLIGGGFGTRFLYSGQYRTTAGELEIGIRTKNSWEYSVEGNMSPDDWGVSVKVRKGIPFGK